jgi:hypothetical protein
VTTSNRILLGVNIDHVATLRQARGTRYPDPVKAALDAEEAGADGITVHLREDRRHIQERDVLLLKDVLQTRMNFEMGVTEEMMAFAERIRPAHICLVPETRQELTTEGGLDVAGQEARIKAAVERLSKIGSKCRCSSMPMSARSRRPVVWARRPSSCTPGVTPMPRRLPRWLKNSSGLPMAWRLVWPRA